jgi:hypothetical protein
MHGLMNVAIQSYFLDTFGAQNWRVIVDRAGLSQILGPDGFEPMLSYDDALTESMLDSASACLGRGRDALLEDLGTYLATAPKLERLRRLLRFGGPTYTEFLFSLDDLKGRAQLAVSDLHLPLLDIEEIEPGHFVLDCTGTTRGIGHVILGVLRALADDYGALVVLDHLGEQPCDAQAGRFRERMMITVHDPAFHTGRRFVLAGAADVL